MLACGVLRTAAPMHNLLGWAGCLHSLLGWSESAMPWCLTGG